MTDYRCPEPRVSKGATVSGAEAEAVVVVVVAPFHRRLFDANPAGICTLTAEVLSWQWTTRRSTEVVDRNTWSSG